MLDMSLRVGGWLGALALIFGWWLATAGGGPAARQRPPHVSEPAPTVVRNHSQFTDRLRRGLRAAQAKPVTRRNPFLFAAERTPPRAEPAPPSYVPPVAVEPPAPSMTLAGIGTSTTPEGIVRTAVISSRGQVWLVKPGDEVPGGLRVVSVGEDHVVLADAAGVETTLRLK